MKRPRRASQPRPYVMDVGPYSRRERDGTWTVWAHGRQLAGPFDEASDATDWLKENPQ